MNTNNRNVRLQQHVILLTVMERDKYLIKNIIIIIIVVIVIIRRIISRKLIK